MIESKTAASAGWAPTRGAPTGRRRCIGWGAGRGNPCGCPSGEAGNGVEVIDAFFLAVGEGIGLVERLQFLGIFRQSRRRLAHVELAGHDVGDQAVAVFAEENDFAPGLSNYQITRPSCVLYDLQNGVLFSKAGIPEQALAKRVPINLGHRDPK
ncbi:MAG: hypothetical protein ACREVY_17790 [Gammaproteobacteria bacterium]